MLMNCCCQRRWLRNVSPERLVTSVVVVILFWIFISRQDFRQVSVQQNDVSHAEAAVVTSGVLLTSHSVTSQSVTSTTRKTKKSRVARLRTTTTSGPDVFMAPTETPSERIDIEKYLKGEEARCLKTMKRMKRMSASGSKNVSVTPQFTPQWCPCLPPDLHGRVLVSKTDNMPWEAIAESVGSDVLLGGEWKPVHCRSHTRMAIIIPCRDRDGHLRTLLRHLIPILKRQLVHFRVFVIDQSHPSIFNKAAIMNVGFLEAGKRFHFDCVVFHDVDHLLEDDRTLINCGSQPHHYASAVDRWNYKLLYGSAFGGVLALTPAMFRKVDGFSNIYFGWGGEDDDMGYRIRRYWKVFRPPIAISRYTTLRHARDTGNPTNKIRHRLMNDENKKYDKTAKIDNGISTLKYRVVDTQTKQFYTWIQASINETFLPYPLVPPAGKYLKVAGLCRLSDSILYASDISMTSCRFRCDTLYTQPCFGYSYQQEMSPHCSLLRSACPLEKAPGAVTYVKLSDLLDYK